MDVDTFGAALRRWRDRLSPVDVGLPHRRGRRAAGLRREELAELAGLSVDYVVRLEQGRARHPSAQVVASLTRALQLSATEVEHAHRLAGLLPPSRGAVSTHVPPGVQRVLAQLSHFPAAVFGADWTLLTWTPAWAALIGDPVGLAPERLNLVRAVFTGDVGGLAAWPVRNADPGMPAALVADLRSALTEHPDDPALTALVEEMRTTSTDFADLWERGAVSRHVSARKTVEHPLVGDVTCDCDVMTVPGSDVRLVVYTVAAGSPDEEKLAFLRVAAGQRTDAPGTVRSELA
ncbi:helix-turn-helix domain-containing protein [Kineococcus terrestris]|uniref:helix-turn-helix domain-containing protein n=1 Tax=Kineococcus terrestris TaxID=2044856 RepID=UPI0034DB79B2